MKNWPTPQDYNEAVQSPQICFSDQDLKRATIETNSMGLPRSASGTFASVYKANCGNTSWAVRCFLSERPDQKERYRHISDFILFDNLDSTVDFYYLEEGIRVKGDWYPCLKMVWVNGTTLDQFIERHHRDAEQMTWLLREFHKLVGELEGAGIAHGDLQHGNILVTDEGLRLVDYDALFVPALLGKKSLEFGHPNYQHPQRTEDHYDPDVDNFSCWIIHASLLAVAIDPDLFNAHGGGDECILFKRTDLANPTSSTLFQSLLSHRSPHISETAHLLLRMLWTAPTAIPYLGAPKLAIDQLATEPPQTNGSKSILSPGTGEDILDLDEAVKAISTNKKKVRKEGLGFSKISTNTFKAGRQARDRIKRLAAELELKTRPDNWMQRNVRDGNNLFDEGDYETAVKIYLEVFKRIDSGRHGKLQIDVAVSIGYCLALSGKSSMASNYFLLALNDAKQNSDQTQLNHAALLLALTKYDDGNHDAAFKVLDDIRAQLKDISSIIALELDQPYIVRISTFKMLKEYGLRPYQKTRFDAISVDFLQASAMVFRAVLEQQKHLCDIEATDQYLELAGIICNVSPTARLEFAKTSFIALSKKLDAIGRVDQAHLARFCGVVVINSADQERKAAFEHMAEFGKIDANELVAVAGKAGRILSPEDVFNWLIAISNFFDSSGDRGEALEAMMVATRFAVDNAPSVDRLLILSLENARGCIATCLEKTYLEDQRDPQLVDNLLALAAEENCINILATIVSHLSKHNNVEGLAVFCHHVARLGKLLAFSQIMSTEGNNSVVMEGCDLAVSTAVSIVEKYRDNVRKQTEILRHGNSWSQCCEQIMLLNNFRDLLTEIGASKESNAILTYLAVEMPEIISAWFLSVVKAGEGDPCFNFAVDLARLRQFDMLASVLNDLVNERQSVIVDSILKHMYVEEGSGIIIEFCVHLKSHDHTQLFERASRIVCSNATIDEVTTFFEALFDKSTNTNSYVCELLSQLLKGCRPNLVARLLARLRQRKEMFIAEGIVDELLTISYFNSPLSPLVGSQDLDTVADILALVAATRNSKGLRQLATILTIAGSDCMENTFMHCIERAVRELDEILALENLETLANDRFSPYRSRVIYALSALHQLRLLCPVSWLKADALKKAISESAHDRFDGFYLIWLLDLADREENAEASSVAIELAGLKKNKCLSRIFMLLAGQKKRHTLGTITKQLMATRHVSTAVALTIQLATAHPYETKELIANIIENSKDEKVLSALVSECLKVNPQVSEMAIRQIASSDKADQLKDMAIRFVNTSNEVALYMVLTQLLATDPDFDNLARSLCEQIPEPLIDGFSRWLFKVGLAEIPIERAKALQLMQRADLAEIWLKCLP